jgi:hypothetical protein
MAWATRSGVLGALSFPGGASEKLSRAVRAMAEWEKNEADEDLIAAPDYFIRLNGRA